MNGKAQSSIMGVLLTGLLRPMRGTAEARRWRPIGAKSANGFPATAQLSFQHSHAKTGLKQALYPFRVKLQTPPAGVNLKAIPFTGDTSR